MSSPWSSPARDTLCLNNINFPLNLYDVPLTNLNHVFILLNVSIKFGGSRRKKYKRDQEGHNDSPYKIHKASKMLYFQYTIYSLKVNLTCSASKINEQNFDIYLERNTNVSTRSFHHHITTETIKTFYF